MSFDTWDAGEPSNGKTVQWLKATSRRLHVWLGTSFLEADGADFYDTFVLTAPSGEEAGRVRKQNPAGPEAYFFRGDIGPHVITTAIGKIGVGIARKVPSRWYALIETGDGVPWNGKPTDTGTLWSSDDAGENWVLASKDRQLIGRAAYYTRCAVSPDNPYELYFMSAAFSHSLDGGRTLTDLPALPGGDNHDMWIDPVNADRMIVANDSGVGISVTHGRTWNRV